MRLVVVTNKFPGHVTTFFARDMAGLIKAGVDIDVLPLYPLEPELWSYVPAILNERVLPRTNVRHTPLIHSLSWPKRRPVFSLSTFARYTAATGLAAARLGVVPVVKNTYACLKAWGWVLEYTKSYDHVLAYWGNYSATAAYLFHRLKENRIPLSIFVHAGLDLYQSSADLRQKLIDADNVITCSQFNRDFLCQQFSDISQLLLRKTYVHYHGLDLSEYSYQRETRLAGMILAVGSLEKYKGFDYLIRALAELCRRGIDAELNLLGGGQEEMSLRKLSAQLGISDKVRFQGWVPPEEVRNVMTRATLLVHPSSELNDGVPNVIKEAMAVGLPVVASSVAGIPELLGYGAHGVLVPPRDVWALSVAVERMLGNETLRTQLADAARSHVEEHFDVWERGRCLASFLESGKRGTDPPDQISGGARRYGGARASD